MSTEARKKQIDDTKPLLKKPATLKEILELAVKADDYTADDEWAVDYDREKELKGLIQELDLAIVALPRKPVKDLGRRLALAEAQHLRLSLLLFEQEVSDIRELRRKKRSIKQLKASSEKLKAASNKLNAAVCAFIAIADGA